MRAAIYARFSTEKQRDASIEDQVRECERIAAANKLDVVARFSDAAISGGTADRPGYQAMLAAARRHDFDVIVVEDISRLWRNRAEFGPRSAELEDLGINCLTCVGDDTRRDGWGLVLQIKQAVAEQARREASYRTRRGLEGKALAGGSVGGRAYGYVPESESPTKQIEIDPEQAAVVRRIFEMYADGVSPRGIAATLNADGLPSPGANWKRISKGAHSKRRSKWVASAIAGSSKKGYGILNNRKYIGEFTWGTLQWQRSAANSSKRRALIVHNGTKVEHAVERLRIIPQDLWDRVKARQAYKAADTGPKGGRVTSALLSGLLLCPKCGSRFVAASKLAYCCSSYKNGGASACDSRLYVNRAVAEKALVDRLRNHLGTPEAIEAARASYAAEIAASSRRPKPDTDALDHEESKLMALAKAGTLSQDIVAVALAEIERKRKAATKAVQGEQIKDFELSAKRYLDALDSLGELGNSDYGEDAQAAVREIVGGSGTVYKRDGMIGAEFEVAGFLRIAAAARDKNLQVGSGGRI
jgi:site-specific DNA recombinase